jgi:hypothetical protein
MASLPPRASGAPAGVPPGGNTKFVVLAAGLLGLIAAVVAWKTCQKPPEPVVVIPDAGPPTQPVGRNLDDDVPPPPPVEDASVEVDAGKKVTTAQGSNGCDVKKCAGSTSSELEQMLAFRVKQAHRCYDTALASDATLQGKVTINVRIGTNGSVCSAGVASNDLATPAVAQCVVNNYFRSANFPPPKGGCADVNIPISFKPRQ